MVAENGESGPVVSRAVDTGFTYEPARDVPGALPKDKASRDALSRRFRAIDRAQAMGLITSRDYVLGGGDE